VESVLSLVCAGADELKGDGTECNSKSSLS
jgi:hypothetical protein